MASPSFRAPLLWLLIPMIGGYLAGYHLPDLLVFPWAALALITLGGSVWVVKSFEHTQVFWPILFLSGVFAASLIYYQYTSRVPTIWENLPPREANLKLKIKRLYATKDFDQTSGIAEIIETEPHLSHLMSYPVYFSVSSSDLVLERGQSVSARGMLTYLSAKENPSLFEQYLEGQSIRLTLTRATITSDPEEGNPLEELIAKVRRNAIAILGQGLEKHPEIRSIYQGMLLGIKGELSQENKELFLRTGTLHLFAISGLHVGIVAVTWAGIFTVLRIPRRLSVVLGLALVYLYVEITGASPSAIRAFAMTAFFWAGKSMVRQMPPFQALVASAVVVLLFAPNQLFSAGFQLSYTVVSGILIWGIPLYTTVREIWQAGIVQKYQFLGKAAKLSTALFEVVAGTLCVSLSATLASAPLSILYFGILAPVAILLNTILVPIASLVIVSGIFSLLFGFLKASFIAAFFNHGPLVLITFTLGILNWTVSIPAAFFPMSWASKQLGYFTVILFLGSLLATRAFKLGKPGLFGFPVVITLGMIFLNLLLSK